jgi:hypothetical protein
MKANPAAGTRARVLVLPEAGRPRLETYFIVPEADE